MIYCGFKDFLQDDIYQGIRLRKNSHQLEMEVIPIIWILQYCRNQVLGTPVDNPEGVRLMQSKKEAIHLAIEFVQTGQVQLRNIYAKDPARDPVPPEFKGQLLERLKAFQALVPEAENQSEKVKVSRRKAHS